MKFKWLLLFPIFCFAQEEETSSRKFYTQFDITVPFTGNENRYDPVTGDSDEPRIMADGVGSKFGIGLHYNRWFGLAIHSGIDWKISSKLVAVPVYANLRIAPNLGDDSRLILQAGYGFGTALGRGDLSGVYKKFSLGFGDSDYQLYLEFSQYGFKLESPTEIYSISVGVSFTTF